MFPLALGVAGGLFGLLGAWGDQDARRAQKKALNKAIGTLQIGKSQANNSAAAQLAGMMGQLALGDKQAYGSLAGMYSNVTNTNAQMQGQMTSQIASLETQKPDTSFHWGEALMGITSGAASGYITGTNMMNAKNDLDISDKLKPYTDKLINKYLESLGTV